jgi:hypothetical protein
MCSLTVSRTRNEKVHHLTSRLDEHLADLASQLEQGRSENLLRYLEFSARFHRYSFGNLMLAFWQRPDMSRLAGLREWNRLGRHVRAGEHGIMILAPMTVRRKTSKQDSSEIDADDDSATVTLFKPVHVFDVSQTEGDPLPDVIHASGEVTEILSALEDLIRSAGITLEAVDYIPVSLGARGASYGGRIEVRSDLSPPDRFRTLVHELAHERLHRAGERESMTIRETEADATAFVVCRRFGVECDSADYLLLHDAAPKVLLERLETIRQTAASIIESLEACFPTAGGSS